MRTHVKITRQWKPTLTKQNILLFLDKWLIYEVFDTRTSDLGILFQLSILQREIKLSLQTLIMRTDNGAILME